MALAILLHTPTREFFLVEYEPGTATIEQVVGPLAGGALRALLATGTALHGDGDAASWANRAAAHGELRQADLADIEGQPAPE